MTGSLEHRLQRVEAVDAIRQLKARYCQFADDPQSAREFADLFLENAVLDEGEDFMILHGREEIFRMHLQTWKHIRLNQHFALCPVIEVDGDRASGYWKLLQLITTRSAEAPDQAFWACGWYQEQYVHTPQGWKFQHVEARVHFNSPYEDGWAKNPMAELLPQATVEAVLAAVREAE
jgi:hypothetical protein